MYCDFGCPNASDTKTGYTITKPIRKTMDKKELMKYAKLVEDLEDWEKIHFEDENFSYNLDQITEALYKRILETIGQITIEEYQEYKYYKGFGKDE